MASASSSGSGGGVLPVGTTITTNVPTRLDRLKWSPWHWTVVMALGITWTLDGLEASLIANVADVLKKPEALGLTDEQVGLSSSLYLIGQVLGALVFGRMTDTFGRKKLFLVTLAVYLAGTALSGLAPNFAFFAAFRFIAGTGIGGEVSAINSAIDELIPARVRGAVDLGINGSYWVGVGLGAMLSLVLLNENVMPHATGWRFVFGLGAVLGVSIALVRKYVPESPRWLLMRGRKAEAEEIADSIETAVRKADPSAVPDGVAPDVQVKVTGSVSFRYVVGVLLEKHLKRSILSVSLMVTQAFFYNAIFFTYALILTKFYAVPPGGAGLYMIPFAAGNFLGPLLLGRLFDTLGRRRMIGGTYLISAVLLAITGYLFHLGVLTAVTQTACWCVVFFFASSAASSAYLTVSELFPVEIRGMAIAVFYAVSQVAGASAPWVFAKIVASGEPWNLFMGYLFGAALMAIGGVVAWFMGVDAEGRSLEDLAEH